MSSRKTHKRREFFQTNLCHFCLLLDFLFAFLFFHEHERVRKREREFYFFIFFRTRFVVSMTWALLWLLYSPLFYIISLDNKCDVLKRGQKKRDVFLGVCLFFGLRSRRPFFSKKNTHKGKLYASSRASSQTPPPPNTKGLIKSRILFIQNHRQKHRAPSYL